MPPSLVRDPNLTHGAARIQKNAAAASRQNTQQRTWSFKDPKDNKITKSKQNLKHVLTILVWHLEVLGHSWLPVYHSDMENTTGAGLRWRVYIEHCHPMPSRSWEQLRDVHHTSFWPVLASLFTAFLAEFQLRTVDGVPSDPSLGSFKSHRILWIHGVGHDFVGAQGSCLLSLMGEQPSATLLDGTQNPRHLTQNYHPRSLKQPAHNKPNLPQFSRHKIRPQKVSSCVNMFWTVQTSAVFWLFIGS